MTSSATPFETFYANLSPEGKVEFADLRFAIQAAQEQSAEEIDAEFEAACQAVLKLNALSAF